MVKPFVPQRIRGHGRDPERSSFPREGGAGGVCGGRSKVRNVRNAIMAMTGADRSKRFRIKNKASLRDKARDRMRAKRAAAKAAKVAGKAASVKPLPETPSDLADAICQWAKSFLKVPPGHPKEGGPLMVPEYGQRFLTDALAAETTHEALLCLGRKNAKSAIVAVLLLAYLVGPLRRAGFRAGVASISKEKAGELRGQIEAISTASGLKRIRFWRRSAPAITSEYGGSVDILSADKNAGAAGSYDLSIIDELGLLEERNRGLVNSMRSSVSAKGGKFLSLSVHGDGPFIPEILERKGAAGLAVHHYFAPTGCALDDEAAHDAANPGLACGIKSRDYMRSEAARVSVTRSDESSFRALDLNQPGNPGSEMIFSLDEWKSCIVSEGKLPERTGQCCVAFDCGGSSSMTALAAIWSNGRCETWGAFPGTPALAERARVDNAPYELMAERGELKVYEGRVTPVSAFLKDCAARLAGEKVLAAGADRYRKAEAMQALDGADLRWPMSWRGMGASAKADGSHDVRAFQRLVLGRNLRTLETLLMASAIAASVIRRDGSGNPALDKGSKKGRIDALSAAVIAAGLAEIQGMKPRRSWRPGGLV